VWEEWRVERLERLGRLESLESLESLERLEKLEKLGIPRNIESALGFLIAMGPYDLDRPERPLWIRAATLEMLSKRRR